MRRAGIRMLGEAADARAQRRAALQAPGERRVLAPRHVAELAAAPFDAHRVRRRADCRARAPARARRPRAAAARPRRLRRSGSRPAASSAPGAARLARSSPAPQPRASARTQRSQDAKPANALRIHWMRAGLERIQQQHVEPAIGVGAPHQVQARRGDQAGLLGGGHALGGAAEALRRGGSAPRRTPACRRPRPPGRFRPCRQRQLRASTRRPAPRSSSAHRVPRLARRPGSWQP